MTNRAAPDPRRSSPGDQCHVYETLADSFVAEGVTTCFALLGDANMAWATAMAARDVRMVYVRHEHCAVAAATAFARKTGQTGIATVTCGPGLTQIMTALPAAVRAAIPLIIFAGEAPLGAPWYNQAIDQAPFVAATGARYLSLHHVPSMARAVRDAFVMAAQERRPVVIGVPFDLQSRLMDRAPLPPDSTLILPKTAPMPPDAAAIARLGIEIDAARRIIVLAGMGSVAADAADACRSLAAKTGALLATTLPARGLFHGDPQCIGIAGGFSTAMARALCAEADLVIAFGARLAQHTTDKGKLFPKARIVQIDTDPTGLSQGASAAHHHLRGDARLVAKALTAIVAPQRGWRSDRLARAIAQTPPDPATFAHETDRLDPRDVVARLDAALPQDWQFVNSSGHCSWFFAQMQRPFAKFLTIREFGAIGNGLSYAMGVAAARPDETVVLFDGDGSLLMHMQELETIRRHGMNILICALNDGAYGSEIHKLRDDGLSDAGAVFGPTDLAAMARGFGIGGARITDLAALPAMAADFAKTGGAALWDFPVSDRIASPVIRRAHPGGHSGIEHPVSLEGLL